LSVTFTPTVAGSVTGNVSVVSSATNSPAIEPLSGTGVHAVNLSWTATSPQVAGYNVYRGSASGGPYSKLDPYLITETAYTDISVHAGQTYYYVTTAVDSSGNESPYSNHARVVVPSP
jgi:fibronectin type 3 domain-containing protein